MATIVALAWQHYVRQLNRTPLKTKALTAALIAGLSDSLAQRLAKNTKNWARTFKLTLFGLVWSGPSAHFWQAFLNKLFAGQQGISTALQKMVIDQLTYGPVCNLLFMSYMTLVVEGRSLQYLKARIQKDYPAVQLQGWKVWPAAGLINYWLVPLKFRVLFINLVAFCWNVFLITRLRKATARVTE